MSQKINKTASASYERNVLTLDLPRASQPMLWRQEIKNMANVVFWASSNAEGHVLLMRVGNGAEQSIARFANADLAEEALAAVRKIFISKKSGKSFLSGLLKVVFFLALLYALGSFAYHTAIEAWVNHLMSTTADAPAPSTAAPAEPPPPVANPAPTAP